MSRHAVASRAPASCHRARPVSRISGERSSPSSARSRARNSSRRRATGAAAAVAPAAAIAVLFLDARGGCHPRSRGYRRYKQISVTESRRRLAVFSLLPLYYNLVSTRDERDDRPRLTRFSRLRHDRSERRRPGAFVPSRSAHPKTHPSVRPRCHRVTNPNLKTGPAAHPTRDRD